MAISVFIYLSSLLCSAEIVSISVTLRQKGKHNTLSNNNVDTIIELGKYSSFPEFCPAR